jgi:hypothetical protein
MAYNYKASLTIDNTKVSGSADLTNFPVLISGTYAGADGKPDLRTVANGGNVTSASGYDIIFTSDAEGNTQLDHEIESYTASTGVINMWVRIPTLDGDADTVIYMWYGNSDVSTSQEDIVGVWDSNHIMVQHLKETSGNHIDSTSNDNDTTTVSVTTQGSATGKINGSTDFEDGDSDYMLVGDDNTLDITGTITLEAWINPETIAGSHRTLFSKGRNTNGNTAVVNYAFRVTSDSKLAFYYNDGSNWHVFNSNAQTLTLGSWAHVAVTYTFGTGSSLKYYLNGSDVTSGSWVMGNGNSATAANALDLGIGKIQWGTSTGIEKFDGILDELRISKSIRSGEWIATEYNNQSSPSTFYTMGSETAATSTAVKDILSSGIVPFAR